MSYSIIFETKICKLDNGDIIVDGKNIKKIPTEHDLYKKSQKT